MPGTCSRGTVLEVNLDPIVGSEANKVRPCVVVQNDIGNRYSPIVIVVAITGAENVAKTYPVDVPVPKGEGGLSKDSVVQCNQIRSVDEKRFVRTLGRLSSQTMTRLTRRSEQACRCSVQIQQNSRHELEPTRISDTTAVPVQRTFRTLLFRSTAPPDVS